MKGAHALLDIESVMREQIEDEQQVKDAQFKMHYRGIKAYYLTKKVTPTISKWLKGNEISPYQYTTQEENLGLLNFFLRCFPEGWEIQLIEREVRAIEYEAKMSDEEWYRRGFGRIGEIGRIDTAKVLFFSHDEVKRKSVAEYFKYTPRVQVCSTYQQHILTHASQDKTAIEQA